MLVKEDLVAKVKVLPASEYIVYPWFLPGRLTLIVGAADVGKTTLTLEIIAQLSKGGHLWERFPAKKITRVLYLHAEHTLATLQEAATIRGDIPEGMVTVVHEFGPQGSSLLRDGKPQLSLIKELKDLINETEPQLIIAEPISAFLGQSENDNFETRLVINILCDLASKSNAALITHHHVGKAHFDPERQKVQGVPAGEARGAMAFEDAAERVIYLKREREENHIRLETPKSKGFPVAPVILSFDEDTLDYTFIKKPFSERDLIAVYDRRRNYPDEKITDLIAYFLQVWGKGSNSRVYLLLKRAARVGLLDENYRALI